MPKGGVKFFGAASPSWVIVPSQELEGLCNVMKGFLQGLVSNLLAFSVEFKFKLIDSI
jgi:hypothetical protein